MDKQTQQWIATVISSVKEIQTDFATNKGYC